MSPYQVDPVSLDNLNLPKWCRGSIAKVQLIRASQIQWDSQSTAKCGSSHYPVPNATSSGAWLLRHATPGQVPVVRLFGISRQGASAGALERRGVAWCCSSQ